jgi:hypothetical protein
VEAAQHFPLSSIERRPARWRRHHGSGARTISRVVVAWFCLVVLTLMSGRAEASPVIPPGKEAVVLGLLAPHSMGSEVVPGCTVRSVQIGARTIDIVVLAPGEELGSMRLSPPSRFGGGTGSKSFEIEIEAKNDPVRECVEVVRKAVLANDDGTFWAENTIVPVEGSSWWGGADREGGATADEDLFEALERMRRTIASLGGPWIEDGTVHWLAIALGIAVLLRASARRDGRWVLLVVGVAVFVGFGLRVWLSAEVDMAPWPYSRMMSPARRMIFGPGLATITGSAVSAQAVIFACVFVYGLLTPAALYVHARYLLADPKRAAMVAGLVALLPLHIRFSHSDTAFIPSITTSALTFALIHVVTREQSRWARWTALVGLPLAMILMFSVRPLNIMYMPLMLATCVLRGWSTLSKRWVIAAVVVVCVATFGFGVPDLLDRYGSDVERGLSLEVLQSSVGVLFSWDYNVLINPQITPTGITLLAGWGSWTLWKRSERRLLAFLWVWLLLFIVAHAYVVPHSVAMQARYHLHLVAPFLMLAACGLAELFDREGRRWFYACVAYVAFVPVLHRGFITDTAYNDMVEFAFVRETAAGVPDGCTVVEYTGEHHGESRFARMAFMVQRGESFQRFESVLTFDEGTSGDDPLTPDARASLHDADGCTFVYTGLTCQGLKDPGEAVHPVCRELTQGLELEVEATQRTPSRPYDGNYAGGFEEGNPDHMTLTLYRVVRSEQ